MPVPGVDVELMISTLLDHDVEFVVIGGFGVELWDVAIQPTIDVDITPEMSTPNLTRLAAALNELDARIRVAGGNVEIPGGLNADLIEQMSVMNLLTSAGPLDLTIVPAGTEGYPELSRSSTHIEYEGISVPTASLRDIARSKEAAGRSKDLRVLPAIHAHIERIEKNS